MLGERREGREEGGVGKEIVALLLAAFGRGSIVFLELEGVETVRFSEEIVLQTMF